MFSILEVPVMDGGAGSGEDGGGVAGVSGGDGGYRYYHRGLSRIISPKKKGDLTKKGSHYY